MPGFKADHAKGFSFSSLFYAAALGIIPAILIIMLVPLNLGKYTVELRAHRVDRYCWFDDLESDGMKERFCTGLNPDSTQHLYVFDQENRLMGQFNFRHTKAETRNLMKPHSLDLNGDGVKEILLYTRNNDSLFLNVFDYAKQEIILNGRFISTIGGYNGKQDFLITPLADFDANGDSISEYYFSVAGGFALHPRCLFRYDFVNDSLISSVNTGASYLKGEGVVVDGTFHLIVSSSASGNIPTTYPAPYQDSCCWIFGFDRDLQLTFDPVPFGSYPAHSGKPVIIKDHAYCIFSARYEAGNRSKVLRVSLTGDVEDHLVKNEALGSNLVEFIFEDHPFHYFQSQNLESTYLMDADAFILDEPKVQRVIDNRKLLLQEDLDGDGRLECLLFDRATLKLQFYPDGQFRKMEEIIPVESPNYVATGNYYQEPGRGEIILCNRMNYETYVYAPNPQFHFRFLIWFAIYLGSFVFVWGVMYLQRRRIERRQKLELQVADLQLQNLRNQLDPHFTFNALNSVGNAIYQENKEKAYDLFQRFTRMIRSSLMVSQQVFRPLSEEIRFTEDYLEFQKTRFRDRFDYTIHVDPDVDMERVETPKMLIQGFAENAVKHAFHGIGYKGQINISVTRDPGGIKITVEDNGIGIKRSKELGATSGTQKGEQILRDQIRQINRLYNRNISLRIADKVDVVDQPSGTLVEIDLVGL